MMIRQEAQKLHKKTVTFHEDVIAAVQNKENIIGSRFGRRSRKHRKRRQDNMDVKKEEAESFLHFLALNPNHEIFEIPWIKPMLEKFLVIVKENVGIDLKSESLAGAFVELNNSEVPWGTVESVNFLWLAMEIATNSDLYSKPNGQEICSETNSQITQSDFGSISDEVGEVTGGHVDEQLHAFFLNNGATVARQSPSQASEENSDISNQLKTSENTDSFGFGESDILDGKYSIQRCYGPNEFASINESLSNMIRREIAGEGDPNDPEDSYGDETNNIWCVVATIEQDVSDLPSDPFNPKRIWKFLRTLNDALCHDPNCARQYLKWIAADDTDATVDLTV